MRIVWKDTAAKKEDFTYRKYTIEGYHRGWIVNIPGDNNVYRTVRCVKNAIDEYIDLSGNNTFNHVAKRREFGYDIIGKKNKIS